MTIKKTLLNFFVDDTLLDRIEDFRFKNRFQTRAAAIKWLLDWALKQKPSPKSIAESIEEHPVIEAKHVEARPVEAPAPLPIPEPVRAIAPSPVPSRASMIQVLRDQGYDVGDAVQHPDGQERTLVRSQDRSAWVNAQELQDLAASRISLSDLSVARAAAR